MHLSGHMLALAGLLGAVTLFYLISFIRSRPNNINDFFHQGNVYYNIISLIASNFGLGLVLIATLTFAHVYGALCFLFPLAMFLGQGFYSKLITRLDPNKWCSRGTILSGLNDELDRTAKTKVKFQLVASVFILVTQMMALCYELYASSEWLRIALLPNPNSIGIMLIIAMILFVVMTYIMTGGYRTTQLTDCLQCLIALPFIILVVCLLFSFTSAMDAKSDPKIQWFPTPSGWIAAISFGTILLSSFTTQIYGVLNHTFASHQKTNSDKAFLFLWARRFGLFLNWLVISAALYCLYNGGSPKGVVEQWLTSKTDSASLVICFVSAAMVAMGPVALHRKFCL